MNISLGDKVRKYDTDDWFFEGKVTLLKDSIATIDFADWIEECPIDKITESWDMYQKVFIIYT